MFNNNEDIRDAISQESYRRKLVQLCQDYPELPLRAQVWGECITDEYAWMLCEITDCDIKEFVEVDGQIYCKEDTGKPESERDITSDVIDLLNILCPIQDPKKDWSDVTDVEILKQYKTIEWRRAIFVVVKT